MGKVPQDWDLCTDALPEETIKLFSADKRVIPTGVKHGTVTVINDGIPFEITTFRVDGKYTDNRRPDSVEFTSRLCDDLMRRDFTVNAMAYNEREGLSDPYGGLEDIKKGILRCVGDGNKRFEEDALRILRCIRFSCRLGFEIEEKTKSAIHSRRELLKNIAGERIRSELVKMAVCDGFYKNLVEFKDVFFVFMPELEKTDGFLQNTPYHIYDVFGHTVRAIESCTSNDVCVRLALLLHDVGKPFTASDDENGVRHFYGHAKVSEEIAKKILTELRFDNFTKDEVCELIKYHDMPLSEDRRLLKKKLGKLGKERFLRLLEVQKADTRAKEPSIAEKRIEELERISRLTQELIMENPCLSLKSLEINGNDLLKIGYGRGKEIGNALNYLLECVVDEKVTNDKTALTELAKKYLENTYTDV